MRIRDSLRGLHARWRDPNSAGGRAISASMWVAVAMVLQYPLRLGGNLIMTQLLAPEAFGLMAAVTALQIGLSLMTDIGIVQSVMRDPNGADPDFLRVTWVVQIMRDGVICVVLMAIALAIHLYGPVLAGAETVYADPDMPGLILVLAGAIALRGFESTAFLLARREMRLGRVVLTEVVAQVVGLATMVAGGLILGNVWALAFGMVAGAITRVVLTHTIFPGPGMALVWNAVHARTIWSFGKWLIGSSLGGFFTNYGDRIVLSALIDKTAFGVYFIAVVWVELFAQLLNRVSGTVYIPYFGRMREAHDGKVRIVLEKHVFLFLAVATASMLAVLLLSRPLIETLYTEAYHGAWVFMSILCFRLLILYNEPARQYIIAVGDSRYFAVINVIGAITSMAAMYVLAHQGLVEWAVAAFAIGTLPTAVMTFLHREVRPYVNLALHLTILALGVGACMGVTYMLTR